MLIVVLFRLLVFILVDLKGDVLVYGSWFLMLCLGILLFYDEMWLEVLRRLGILIVVKGVIFKYMGGVFLKLNFMRKC